MTGRSVLRMVDANANRALEGIRVCEDIVRFHLESSRAFTALRTLRHALARAIQHLPVDRAELLRARGSARDVGRRAPASPEPSLERLLLMNFQRTKESLRVLEECMRVIAPRQARAFQRLRFQTYDVERETLLRLAALRHP